MMGFFPGQKYGGPPVSVNNFCSLMNKHECYIVTRNHDLGDNDNPYINVNSEWNDRENCKVKYLSDKEYGYKEYKNAIKEIKPDLIYLQGLFQSCVLPCLLLARRYRIPVLLAPRGELCKGAFRKKYKKVPYIIFAKTTGLLRGIFYQSTSDEETEAIKKHLGADSSRILFLPNIPSIPNKNYDHPLKESGTAKFIFLSRIVPKKNLTYSLEILSSIKEEVEYHIYGSNEDAGYWEKCKRIIDSLPSNIKVTYEGNITHDEVQSTFAKYDAFLFPTFSENYGHAIVEALSVGCPSIISDQTPWIDLEDYHAGWAINLNRKEDFVKAIQVIVDNDEEKQSNLRNGSIDYFNRKMEVSKIKEKYETALEMCIKV